MDNPEIIEDVGNIWNAVPTAHTWTPLDPKPGCLTVNIGDGLTRWTDGLLKSTYHRVRTPGPGENLVRHQQLASLRAAALTWQSRRRCRASGTRCRTS